jgi:hypothetical protein
MSFHQTFVWRDEQIARENPYAANPASHLHSAAGQTYFVGQTGLDN